MSFIFPCEWCGRPTLAEPFMGTGVPPCCKNCWWKPLAVGVILLLASGGLVWLCFREVASVW